MRALAWIAIGLCLSAAPVLVAPVWAAPVWAAPVWAAPVIDNAEVTVDDVTLRPGEMGPALAQDHDTVILFVQDGRVRTRTADGRTSVAERRFGDAMFLAKGSSAVQEAVGGGPVREVVIALKARPKAVANTTGLVPAFPRPGSIKRLENDRVVVWNYSWKPGQPTPMHFHDKEVVLAYRDDATLRSTTPDGKVVDNHFKAGEIRFNPANRSHSVLLLTERESAVMMELKP